MSEANKTLVVTCEASVDISSAQALHQHLAQALQEGQTVEIEARDVQRADAVVIQIIFAYMREAAARGLNVRWRNVSPALQESARLLGLSKALGVEG